MAGRPHGRVCLHNPAPRRPGRALSPTHPTEEQEPMNKLLTALLAAAFAASPVLAQTTAPAKDEKKAEAKKEAAPAADAKKAEPAKAEAKKDEKKKPKGGC
jgi:Tfp pilus assembly protein PilN